jgi:hypothetical protein
MGVRYEIAGIVRSVWGSFYVGEWGFEDQYILGSSKESDRKLKGPNLHVPVNLIFVGVTNTFRFKIAENIDDSLHRLFHIPIPYQMFNSITTLTRPNQYHICSIRQSTSA